MLRSALTLAVLLSGCAGEKDNTIATDDTDVNTTSGDADTDTDTDTDSDADADADSDADADTDADTDADSDADTDTDTDTGTTDTTTEPEHGVVRFIAMGDGGEGNDDQYMVSDAVEAICAAKADADGDGCQFVLYLGDNFYDEGVDGLDDEQFVTKFEAPYANLDIPFYIALGNHDYGGCIFGECGAGFDFDKSQYYVDYTAYSDKWTMPSEYYTFVSEHVQFFALDTNAIMWDPWLSTAPDQPDWLQDELNASTADWKIAYGHHPYISNGAHGNAGEYEGLDWLDWLGVIAEVPIGTRIKEVMDDSLCGQVDLYVCGHDHNRQWLVPTCGTEFIVMGSASKTTDLEDRGNPTDFEDDTEEGFVWIEIRGNELTGEIYDKHGNLDHANTLTK